jgi:hypothetical protein
MAYKTKRQLYAEVEQYCLDNKIHLTKDVVLGYSVLITHVGDDDRNYHRSFSEMDDLFNFIEGYQIAKAHKP